MELGAALGVGPQETVAFVGAGGKTAALYRLAHELLAQGKRIVATTTTHMRPPAGDEWPLVVAGDAGRRLASAAQALVERGRVFVAADWTPEGTLAGVGAGEVAGLAALADAVLVEADGARGRWLKAPAEYEPVIPDSATLVVPVAGLMSIGRPLAGDAVHRPERVAALLAMPPASVVTEDLIARLIRHPQGGLRGVPPRARVVPLCNQADSPERSAAGRRVAAALLGAQGRIRRVVVGAIRTSPLACERWEPSAVVVLAAGAGRRYGRLKQAEDWEGQPLLARAVAAGLSSLATEVLVVLGCQAERLAPLVVGPPERLRSVVNRSWQEGLASSVRAGLQALGDGVQAAVFCSADQPLLSAREIDALLTRQAATGASLAAPRCGGQLRSPVLFARPLFGELAALQGDTGGRAVLERHRDEGEYVPVLDPLPYEDIDTPADLRRLGEHFASRKTTATSVEHDDIA